MCDLMIFHHDGDMMSALYSTPPLWSGMFVTKGLKKQILKTKTRRYLLFGIEGRCPVWVYVKKIKKIIRSTQREMHVFAQCMKARTKGRLTGRICQNLFPSYFTYCLWNPGKTITGKHWGKVWVWTQNELICLFFLLFFCCFFSNNTSKWRIRNKHSSKFQFFIFPGIATVILTKTISSMSVTHL